jgi:phosphatidylserine/phosphatidylglycerophosphate/cardiolipin synthase-like enzyme
MELSRNRGKQNHRKQLVDLIGRSEVSVLCSAWLKHDGLVELLPVIDVGLAQNASITIYSNEEHTEEAAEKAIAERAALKHFIISKQYKYLHSKLYYFEHGGQFTALIGSANITYGGLVRNEELSVRITGRVGDDQQQKILGYLDELREVLRVPI